LFLLVSEMFYFVNVLLRGPAAISDCCSLHAHFRRFCATRKMSDIITFRENARQHPTVPTGDIVTFRDNARQNPSVPTGDIVTIRDNAKQNPTVPTGDN
jgi:hypothetical protein